MGCTCSICITKYWLALQLVYDKLQKHSIRVEKRTRFVPVTLQVYCVSCFLPLYAIFSFFLLLTASFL
ncbi:hypothetical protein A4A49_24437 [Nicotiana attenuata]|uniref:Uncharacterized protein n=1 Tax=Nicotiana attenuata TaxID=49451 RepID=A0A314KPC2_NICAT|nr:hypothetical protein A4A49_24437 [Nicotiana attenuata]